MTPTHEQHMEQCRDHFVTRVDGMRAIWAMLSVSLVLIGSSVAWALTKTAEVASVQTQLELVNKRLDVISVKLDAIQSTVSERR